MSYYSTYFWPILWILHRILGFIRLPWGGRQILYLLKAILPPHEKKKNEENPRRYFAINLSKNIWRKQSFQYYQSDKFNNYNYFNDKNLIMWFEQYDFPQCLSISVFPVSIPMNFRGNFHFITCYSLVSSLMDFLHKWEN